MTLGTICIVTGNHLCHNPRVIKEAATLIQAGYKVQVLGGWFDSLLKTYDQELTAKLKIDFKPVLDFTVINQSQRIFYRLQTKIGQLAHAKFGYENIWQLGYFAAVLRRATCRSNADLFIAHSEAALEAVATVQRRGKRVSIDMEDWFSEDLLPEARKQRPVQMLRVLEQTVLRVAAHSSCTSRAMSNALAKEFDCRPPLVLYNAFEWSARNYLDGKFKDRVNLDVPSIHWYSQTLGRGRGLEDLLAALPYLEHKTEIHLRGNPVRGFEEWLASRVPAVWRSRIFVHELVSNEELLSRIAEHDMGFAGEMKYSRSRDLTITNKILQYLLCGLSVVASDTTGQREVAQQADDAVQLYEAGQPQALAAQLNRLLGSPEMLQRSKAIALRVAEQTFCWERCAPRLVEVVQEAMCLPKR